MTDFEKVIDFGNMYKAYRRSKCGKGYKNSAAKFNLMALEGVNALITQLKDKTYKVSDYTEFKVYEPKERMIKTTSFKDKVIQHCLCDNVILPKLQEIFIYDNCAGQKGKGTLFGLDRLSEQMQDFYRKHGFEGYILKCDISKFFYNISHDELKNIVHYYFGHDEDICWLCDLFIDSTDGKGIPLGNQINQGFALLCLGGQDMKCHSCVFDVQNYHICSSNVARNARLLILKQQTEIHRLIAEKDALIKTYGECMTDCIKDFTVKLKEEQYFYEDECGDFVGFVPVAKIDELVKEMLKGEK